MEPKPRKNYTNENVKLAQEKVNKKGWTIYRASKVYKIPYTTLKQKCKISNPSDLDSVKIGRPFNLSTEQELEIVSYINEMQETGIKLTASDIRKYAYKLSMKKCQNQFNTDKKVAGWDWWFSFKKRYDISTKVNLRTPLPMMDKSDMFFSDLSSYVEKHFLRKEHIWFFIRTNFSYVTESETVGRTKSKPEIVNVIFSINAAGQRGAPLIVSKGSFSNDHNPVFDNSFITTSQDGMIDEKIFYEYINYFMDQLSDRHRPIVIVVNSKNEYISPKICIFTTLKGIRILRYDFDEVFVLRAFQTYLLSHVKYLWIKEVGKFVKQNHCKPTSEDFLTMFSSVYLEGTNQENITNGMCKIGIWPLNPDIFKSRKNVDMNSSADNEFSTSIEKLRNHFITDVENINNLELSINNIKKDDEVVIVIVE